MAGDILTGIDVLRMILDTETDHASPDNETTYGGIRKAIEALFLLLLGTGASGTLTSDPPDDTTGWAIDTAAGFTDDLHNGRTLVFTDGLAIGEMFTIDDTEAGNNRVECAGDNLYDAGARSGDNYVILFDILNNSDGHDHDDVNSPSVVLADAQVTQAKLKTSMSAISVSATETHSTLPGGEYGFYPQIKMSGGSTTYFGAVSVEVTKVITTAWTTYKTAITLKAPATKVIYAQQRYVTASGDIHWLFLLKDKATGETISVCQAPDHPCFGNGNRPLLVPHPFNSYNPKDHEIIVVNPTADQIEDATARTIPIVGGDYLTAKTLAENKYAVDGTRPVRDLLEVFAEDFEINESKDADWPDIPITVGLPVVCNGKIVNDYRFMAGEMVTPIKVRIEKPDYITPLGIKLKEVAK